MKLFQLSIATALFVMFLATPHANADFLGLVPGDYAVTLSGTSAACGGVNCTGTVHIGSPGATGFDWDFTIGTDIFNFDGPGVNSSVSPSGLNTVACESNTQTMTCDINDAGGVVQTGLAPDLLLKNVPGQGTVFAYIGSAGFFPEGVWSATRVPEPLSSVLLLIGLGALGLKAKRD